MKTLQMLVFTTLALALACTSLRTQDNAIAGVLPDVSGSWTATAATARYDTRNIFDYLDGGAELYLAYGMTSAQARRYASPGKPAIEATVFTMRDPAGAFGVFTYERMDSEAGIGQGSEYGGGILRFWQGREFVFLQTESETPDTRAAMMALGRQIASRLGPPAPGPSLVTVLPAKGRRAHSLRFTLAPTVLQNLEPTLAGNPLGFPPLTPAVLGRYGRPEDQARIIVIALPDSFAAMRSASTFRERFIGVTPGDHAAAHGVRSSNAHAVGRFLILILDMPRASVARRHLQDITTAIRRLER